MRGTPLDRLYCILDAESVTRAGYDLLRCASQLCDVGVSLLQYRDKHAAPSTMRAHAEAIAAIFQGSDAILILNDSPHIAVEAGWHGVHVGQSDASVAAARRVVGPDRIVGVSTHTLEQITAASQTSADYIAFGPVFSTSSKADAEPVVGLEGLRDARVMCAKPLVAIGGVTAARLAATLSAGADSVAVISALFADGKDAAWNAHHLLWLSRSDRE